MFNLFLELILPRDVLILLGWGTGEGSGRICEQLGGYIWQKRYIYNAEQSFSICFGAGSGANRASSSYFDR